MIIPLAHENMRGRRWPWVTITIIALNVIVFLATYGVPDRESAQIGQTELRIIVLSAHYPDAPMTPEASQMVEAFKYRYRGTYQVLADRSRPGDPDPSSPGQPSGELTPDEANARMASLCADLDRVYSSSFMWNYAFHSFQPTWRSYLTAMFLHGGWLHIIFNMWFLWLSGTVLEDLWGRIIYPIFYLATGVLACVVHGAVFPNSLVPVLGASGAIAGLMGAFLARFPKTRIRLGWWFFFVGFYKFYVPAYVILPMWLALQILPGMLSAAFHIEGGVAYWAHIGGFAFGALGAVLLRATGIEQSADAAIEAKVSWTADPRIVRATESIGDNRAHIALGEMKRFVQEQPDSLDGWQLLLQAQEKSQDFEGQKESLATLVRLRVASGDVEGAWADYEALKRLGGARISRGVWLELCRYCEQQQWWGVAATEYENLAEANPGERSAVSALVSAARIRVERLHEHGRAEKLFQAAAASPAPHSDLDAAIQAGLKQCAAAVPQAGSYSH